MKNEGKLYSHGKAEEEAAPEEGGKVMPLFAGEGKERVAIEVEFKQ